MPGRSVLCGLLVLFAVSSLMAQEPEDPEILDEHADINSVREQQDVYRIHPLDLNATVYEELKMLRVLNDIQIQALLEHIRKNGKLLSLYELQSVPYFDEQVITALLPYVTVEETGIDPAAGSLLLIRYGRELENRHGFVISDPEKAYSGDPSEWLFKYRFKTMKGIEGGFVAEKDAGERIGPGNGGFDFYSGNLVYNPGKGILRKIIAGDYQLRIGQGLAVWNGYALSKRADVLNVIRREEELKPYSSANETRFFRGTVFTLNYKHLYMNFFYSNRDLDGKKRADSGFTYYTNGFHRTVNELQFKGQLNQQLAGSRVSYKSPDLLAGITSAIYTTAEDSGYRETMKLISADYFARYRNMILSAELAYSNRSFAFVQALSVIPDPAVQLSFVYRNYSPGYRSLFASGFAEKETTNEKGLYAGLSLILKPRLKLNLYADIYRFPVHTGYEADRGCDLFAELNLKLSKSTQMLFRGRSEWNDLLSFLPDAEKVQRFSYEIRYKLLYIELKTRAETMMTQDIQSGILFLQDMQIKMSRKLNGSFRYVLFESLQGRPFYTYENPLPYSHSFAVLSGSGVRTYALLKYKINGYIQCSARYALTWYKGMVNIGTGLDKIAGNKRSEINAQFILHF